jgi:hypothetical protein
MILTRLKQHRLAVIMACAFMLAALLLQAMPAFRSGTVNAADYVRIKSRWQGTYLYEDGNQVKYGAPPAGDLAAQWLIEDVQGSKRIRNRATGNYMAIEHLRGYIESIPVQDAWDSARWTVEDAPTAGYKILRSSWRSREAIHIENLRGYAEYGAVSASWESPQWLLEPVAGGAPATPARTATPTTSSASAVTATTPPASAVTATTPPLVNYVRIRNGAQGAYLYEADNQVKYGTPPASDLASQWLIEDVKDAKRIRNRATGNYMAIEHARGYVESIPVQDTWGSARWRLENSPTASYSVIRSVWHSWEVLHIKDQRGHVQYGQVATSDASAQWLLESPNPPTPTQTGPTSMPGPTSTPIPPGSRGATVPWIEYEAESGVTNGVTLAPSRTFGQIAAESSGRRSVQLNAAGQYVQFTAAQTANAIVVRYVIPDAPDGGGTSATISLYIDGAFRQKLNLTSKYAWSYGGETNTSNDPGAGGAHHFFDEARALVSDIPAGATVKLQKDDDDSAAYYVIDLVDLEQVAAPASMPANFLSIAECGATPDDDTNDGPAIQTCINQARAQGKGVWIPSGVFESTTQLGSNMGIAVADVTIRGAGMWRSTVHGPFARFHCTGNNCRFYDFAILGETTQRDDKNPENGFNGGGGSGSRLENVWVEHTKVGWWVGEGARNVTDGLVITGSRFRNLFADGVNLCNGSSNSVVENSHFRNTGDDALASWAPAFDGGVNANNVFRFNTVQLPWRANCFAIYGGRDNRIEDNLCYDVITYPGILIAQDFSAHAFAGTTTVQRNSLIRAGGPMWSQEHGALKVQAANGPISGLAVRDIEIDSPTFSGVQIQGSFAVSDASFTNIRISNPGTWGVDVTVVSGDATLAAVTVANPSSGGLRNESPGGRFAITRGADNSGW